MSLQVLQVAQAAIVDRWLAAATSAYGGLIAQQAATERDPFRNPIGHALRQSMTALVGEFFGAMDAAAVGAAFADIMALRSIQDLSAEQAIGFVFALRGIAREEAPEMKAAEAEARVDRFALSAFTQYLACRERLAELKLNEQLRNVGVARRRAAHEGGTVT